MAASSAEQLFERIVREFGTGEYEACARHAGTILQTSPEDGDAAKCKGVALILAGKLEQALGALRPEHRFERAYCLYRLQRNDEAAQVLGQEGQRQEEKGEKQLRAQLLYRQGRFREAYEAYRAMRTRGDSSSEVETNMLAAAAAANLWDSDLESLLRAQERGPEAEGELHELAYNAGCLL